MATVTVEEILVRAQSILQDATGLRWPPHELMRWLNDAYREIVLLRPDAHAQVETLTCVAGARQDLRHEFPSALRLLDVVRLVPGDRRIAPRGVRSVEREMLDDIRPYWYGERPTHEIEHFCFDPRIPTQFLVYPPAAEGARLEVAFSSVPTAHDECPDLPDFCQPPCEDEMAVGCCDPIGGVRLFASVDDVLELDGNTYLRSGILADADAYPALAGTPFVHPAGMRWELVTVAENVAEIPG